MNTEDVCQYENLPQRKSLAAVHINIRYLNNLTHLISSEETLTESIKAVKEMIEKINSIDMSGRLIEKPKISKTKALSFNQ